MYSDYIYKVYFMYKKYNYNIMQLKVNRTKTSEMYIVKG